MLVGTPFSELAQILKDALRVGVEDVRAVLVDQNAVVVIMVIVIAADVVELINDKNLLIRLACQPLRKHAAGKTRSYYQIIKHGNFSYLAM